MLDKWGIYPGVHVEYDYSDYHYGDEDDPSKAAWSGGVERKDLTWCLDISQQDVVGMPGAPVQPCCPVPIMAGRWSSRCGSGCAGGMGGIQDAFSAAVILVVIPSAKARAQMLQNS